MFVVRLGLDSLKVSPTPPLFVSGTIWLELGDRPFPEYDWTDTVLSVIGSLGTAIKSARSGETADFYFFDGPYFVKLSPQEQGPAEPMVGVAGVCDRLHLLGEEEGGVVEAETVVPLAELESVYVRCVQDLRVWAEEHGHAEMTALLSQKYSL